VRPVLDLFPTLGLAVAALLLGTALNNTIPWLKRFSIPDPITGGLVAAIALAVSFYVAGVQPSFETALKTPLLLTFFVTIGLSSDLKLIVRGGPRLLLFIALLFPLIALQNLAGIAAAVALDLHPLLGLVGGSITLIGGHGTGAAYAERFADTNNIRSIMEITMAAATFGLVAGGVVAGPVAQWLITRNGLSGAPEAAPAGTPATLAAPEEPVSARTMITMLAAITLSLVVGRWLETRLGGGSVSIPAFLWCLMVGVALRAFGDATGLYRVHEPTNILFGTVSLSLFLTLTMLGLRIWELAASIGPLLLILFLQGALVVLFSVLVCFRTLGRTYDAALLSTGLIGFALGSTATAMANMQTLAKRFGPSPQAFLIVPVVGAFFVDLLNALVLTGFLSTSMFAP
jgi:glutamate:Na+ symporter, ESS family